MNSYFYGQACFYRMGGELKQRTMNYITIALGHIISHAYSIAKQQEACRDSRRTINHQKHL